MSRALPLLLCVLAAGAVAQPVTPTAARGADAEAAQVHLLEIHSGLVWLDGRALPPGSVPDGLDLRGIEMELEFSGPVTPVIEVDGEPFVLEGERLVAFAASSKAGSPVYILSDTAVAPAAAPAERLEPVVEAAYMEQVSEADQTLYDKLQRERALDAEAQTLARRARALPPGAERDALVRSLRTQIEQAFALKQEVRRAELERAESDLRALRAVLDERDALHAEIVEHRLRELLGQ